MLGRTLPAILVVIGLGLSTLLYVRTAESRAYSSDPHQAMNSIEDGGSSRFLRNLPRDFQFPVDEAGELLLKEYGAVFVAQDGVVTPKKIFFETELDVQLFQRSVEIESEKLGGVNIELQKRAMRALEKALRKAKEQGISISPRGADSGRRGYNQTIALWRSRVEPALTYWVSRGSLKATDARKIREMPMRQQINAVLTLEKDGIFFAKSLDKSIIYSVAPPGSSQHIAMLAFDVKEFDDPQVRSILSDHGWFQTVVSDLPHFTYVGVKESDLPDLGLKKVRNLNRDFWVPDFPLNRNKKPGKIAAPPIK